MPFYEKMNKKIIFLAILASLTYMPCTVSAYSYDWPIITNSTVSVNPAKMEITVTADIGGIRINDPTITGDEMVYPVLYNKGVDVFNPTSSGSTIGIFHDVTDSSLCSNPNHSCGRIQETYAPNFRPSTTTFKEMVAHASAAIGQKYTKTVPWGFLTSAGFPICLGFITPNHPQFGADASVTIRNSKVWWAGDYGANANGCYSVNITNPDEYCTLVTPSVDFQFGSIGRKNVANASVTKNIQVSCTSDVQYVLRLLGPKNLQLSNGMSAAFTFNGMAESSTIQGQEGLNNVTVTATLVDYNESIPDGAFDGDGVFMLNYP